jgi:hypothetical protein
MTLHRLVFVDATMVESKNLALDNSFLPAFKRRLVGSLVMGDLLVDKPLQDGHLSVWVPHDRGSIRLEDLDNDIFYPSGFSFVEDLYEFLDNYFVTYPLGLLVAVTSREESWDNSIMGDLPWFSCDLSDGSPERPILAYLSSQNAHHDMYGMVDSWSARYPKSWVLSSMSNSYEIKSHECYKYSSELVTTIIETIDHILIGVFDETSMMVWSRSLAGGT